MRPINQVLAYAVADTDFYAPMECATEVGEVFAPTVVPTGWQSVTHTVWTLWSRSDGDPLIAEGWKVHVSARSERVGPVLDRAAAACFELGVSFKHLANRLVFRTTQGRHGPRQQGGKIIAAYPSSVEQARELMERLRTELADEEGPFILSDRRYRDSRTVHYRYGSFVNRAEVAADGRMVLQVRDGEGAIVADVRGPSMHLPAGIVDPFVAPTPPRPAPPASTSAASTSTASTSTASTGNASPLRGFTVAKALQFSNAGGIYRGRDDLTGREVVIKEARSHTGLGPRDATATEQLREEWSVLTALRELAPGVAPEPIAYLRVWEHEFLVMELVPGMVLGRWVSLNHPALRPETGPADLVAYYDQCQRLLSQLERQLARVHAAGFCFGDISPTNLMVGPDESIRLIDFGCAFRIGAPTAGRWGTPGYAPSDPELANDDIRFDDYGVSAVALTMLNSINQVVEHNAAVLPHARVDLDEIAPVPAPLWDRVMRYHDLTAPGRQPSPLPDPAELAADPVRHLADLRDRVAAEILASADVTDPGRVFPTVVEGYGTNTTCVAFGTAGVVHALRRAGREIPAEIVERLRRDATEQRDSLAPGLHVGLAGIARVLADGGQVEEAQDLLKVADHHPITARDATLAGGAAGVALAHLALHRSTGDQHHLDRAQAIAVELAQCDDLTPSLGRDNAVGLLHGRTGIALLLQQVAEVTGADALLDRAVELLHAELDRSDDEDPTGLTLPVSAVDRRAMPYLYAGTAGLAYVTTRVLAGRADERLTAALPRMLTTLRLPITAMPGLYQGVAGFALVLADHARLTGTRPSHTAALRASRGLFKHAVPHGAGVRFLGEGLLKFSSELWSGGAGVLLALTQVLDPGPDGLLAVTDTLSTATR